MTDPGVVIGVGWVLAGVLCPPPNGPNVTSFGMWRLGVLTI